ncbi:hypothetical protein HZS_5510, partial [Henneguya salminicola]
MLMKKFEEELSRYKTENFNLKIEVDMLQGDIKKKELVLVQLKKINEKLHQDNYLMTKNIEDLKSSRNPYKSPKSKFNDSNNKSTCENSDIFYSFNEWKSSKSSSSDKEEIYNSLTTVKKILLAIKSKLNVYYIQFIKMTNYQNSDEETIFKRSIGITIG